MPLAAAADRPNIVLILADDLGFTDTAPYGSEIRTPAISELAARGIRFTNFHTAASCAPSRAMLLTGVDSHRNGVPNIPESLPPEQRAPDSIQFNLPDHWTDAQARRFQAEAKARGVSVQVFGLSEGNARAFWNWQFLGTPPDLPKTRDMLMRACDVRLPARLTLKECDIIADVLLSAVRDVMDKAAA